MNKEQLDLLKVFVDLCRANPSIIHSPELSFYKHHLLSWGARIPESTKQQPEFTATKDGEKNGMDEQPSTTREASSADKEEDIVESDIELDELEVVMDEDLVAPEYADMDTEVTDEMMDKANDKRNKAMEALAGGEVEQAVSCLTQSIHLNPLSAMIYAKRASAYLRLGKPRKAIHDASRAIEMNPDSAQGYKWRGKAHRSLGDYEQAYHDLTVACRLDYNDDANAVLHEVTPNAKKIMEHKRRYERLHEELGLKERAEKIRKAREAHEAERQRRSKDLSGASGSYPGFPGSSGEMPGMPNMGDLLKDPDLLRAMQDPEVSAAFQDVAANPANMSKYQNNPRVQKILNNLSSKFGGGAGCFGSGDGKQEPPSFDVD